MIQCPVCNTEAGNYCIELLRGIREYSIYKCVECGLEYTYPLPSSAELLDFYADYTDIRADEKVLLWNAENNIGRLKKLGMTSQSKVLDFGAGKGVFGKLIGNNCDSVDIKDDIVSVLNYYDIITMWGVLEHLPNIDSIRNICKYLKKNGLLVITTVNAESNIPYYYKPPEHLTYWTYNAIKKLADIKNFKLEVYEDYEMWQKCDIYFDRLLSRTPAVLVQEIKHFTKIFKENNMIRVPTNECFVVMRKI